MQRYFIFVFILQHLFCVVLRSEKNSINYCHKDSVVKETAIADGTKYTITVHDGDDVTKIQCNEGESLTELLATQTSEYWQFYGWMTEPLVEETAVAPEIISFPYTPEKDVDLYAIYTTTTSEQLIMRDKKVPYGWKVDETLCYNRNIALLSDNYIEIPFTEDMIRIDVDMQLYHAGASGYTYLNIQTDVEDKKFTSPNVKSGLHTYTFTFDSVFSASLKLHSVSTEKASGVLVRSIRIHQLAKYSMYPKIEDVVVVEFDVNGGNEINKACSVKQILGGDIVLPSNPFTSADKDFIEWNTFPDGSGEGFVDHALIKNLQDSMVLYAQWGEEIAVEPLEEFAVASSSTIDRLVIKANVLGEVGEVSISEDENLCVSNSIVFEKTIDNTRYYSFSLPYDCFLGDVIIGDMHGNFSYAPNLLGSELVIYRYDQTLATRGTGDIHIDGWCEILDENYLFKSNQGYILGYWGEEENVVVSFISKGQKILAAPEDKIYNLGEDYKWYTEGSKLSDNGWNLIGQPFYETLTEGDLTQYVTIPNADSKTYTQCLYKEALERGLITPFSAFFVQLKENEIPTIRTEELDYTLFDSEKGFGFIEIYLSGDNGSDRTSLFNAEQHTADYEIGNDLKKWIGYADRPQIYTIENGIPLAYNMQKIDELTRLKVGLYAPTDGEYTFSAGDNCGDLFLLDKQEDVVVDLAESSYDVWLQSGVDDDRFEIIFQELTATDLAFDAEKIECFVEDGVVVVENMEEEDELWVYDCIGKLVVTTQMSSYKLPFRGVYHIIVKNINKKVVYFDVIY